MPDLTNKEASMQYVDRYPIIVTDAFAQCRDFWTRHLGFAVVFENDWFVYLQADGASIAFMSPEHPSWPPGPEGYAAGTSMELEVKDAEAALAEVRASGKEPDYPLTDEPFGQRRFSLKDPSGLWINVVQQL
jgi:catechol 2,3-dioxygenase-like lactoylglutathione lyase family enzyme